MDSTRIQKLRNLATGKGDHDQGEGNQNNNFQVKKVERNATIFDSCVDEVLGRTGFNVFTKMSCKEEEKKVEKVKEDEDFGKEFESFWTFMSNLFISCIV
jgi:hypothetical protein